MTHNELECLAVSGLIPLGVNPCTYGSSGTVVRNLSRFALNTSTLQFVMFLIDSGRLLNVWGPHTCNEFSRIDMILCVVRGIFGILQNLPRLSDTSLVIPISGIMFSRNFQTNITA